MASMPTSASSTITIRMRAEPDWSPDGRRGSRLSSKGDPRRAPPCGRLWRGRGRRLGRVHVRLLAPPRHRRARGSRARPRDAGSWRAGAPTSWSSPRRGTDRRARQGEAGRLPDIRSPALYGVSRACSGSRSLSYARDHLLRELHREPDGSTRVVRYRSANGGPCGSAKQILRIDSAVRGTTTAGTSSSGPTGGSGWGWATRLGRRPREPGPEP